MRAAFDTMPIGLNSQETELNRDYLAPYQLFIDHPFLGIETREGHPAPARARAS